jgi:hypothetical protein
MTGGTSGAAATRRTRARTRTHRAAVLLASCGLLLTACGTATSGHPTATGSGAPNASGSSAANAGAGNGVGLNGDRNFPGVPSDPASSRTRASSPGSTAPGRGDSGAPSTNGSAAAGAAAGGSGGASSGASGGSSGGTSSGSNGSGGASSAGGSGSSGTSGGPPSPPPQPAYCTKGTGGPSYGGTVYYCNWYPTPVPGVLPGGQSVTDFFTPSNDWVQCEQWGSQVTAPGGKYWNHWWGWAMESNAADDYTWGWVNAVYTKDAANDGGFLGAPNCDNAHGSAP